MEAGAGRREEREAKQVIGLYEAKCRRREKRLVRR